MARDRRRSGGAANYEWNRAYGRENLPRLPPEEEHELYLAQLDNSFYDEACGGHHQLREHAQCRRGHLKAGHQVDSDIGTAATAAGKENTDGNER